MMIFFLLEKKKKIKEVFFMSFTLKIKDKIEEREIDGELTIKDLLDDLDFSSETMVSKKNGEIVIDEEIIEDGDEIEFI